MDSDFLEAIKSGLVAEKSFTIFFHIGGNILECQQDLASIITVVRLYVYRNQSPEKIRKLSIEIRTILIS
jgi:hypothetical protein